MAKVTQPTESTDMPKTTHKVLSPLKHNGKRYAVGSSVDLTDEELVPLIATGTVTADAVVIVVVDANLTGDNKPE